MKLIYPEQFKFCSVWGTDIIIDNTCEIKIYKPPHNLTKLTIYVDGYFCGWNGVMK